MFMSHVKVYVGNGKSVWFFLYLWHPEGRLPMVFPVLFSYCSVPGISIADLAAKNWDMEFRRSLSPAELENWQQLVGMFPTLSDGEDSTSWTLPSSSNFWLSLFMRHLWVVAGRA